MRTIACILAAGLCLVAACGDDDDSSSGDSKEFVDAISTSLQSGDVNPSPTTAEANCVAQAIVDSVGVKALKDAGVTPQKLGDAEDLKSLDVEIPSDAKSKLTNGLKDCKVDDNLKDQVVFSVLDTVGVTVSAPSVDCVTAEIDGKTVRTAFADLSLDASTDTGIEDHITDAFAACPDTMTEAISGSDALSEAYGGEVPDDDDSLACIGQYVTDNADDVSAAFVSGDLSSTASDIAAACPAPAATEAPAA